MAFPNPLLPYTPAPLTVDVPEIPIAFWVASACPETATEYRTSSPTPRFLAQIPIPGLVWSVLTIIPVGRPDAAEGLLKRYMPIRFLFFAAIVMSWEPPMPTHKVLPNVSGAFIPTCPRLSIFTWALHVWPKTANNTKRQVLMFSSVLWLIKMLVTQIYKKRKTLHANKTFFVHRLLICQLRMTKIPQFGKFTKNEVNGQKFYHFFDMCSSFLKQSFKQSK